VSNVSLEVKEDRLIDLFRPYGIVGFEWLKKMTEKRMAFVVLSTVPKAVEAVMYLHCTMLGGRNIRISFSKKEPESIELLKEQQSQQPQQQQQDEEAVSTSVEKEPPAPVVPQSMPQQQEQQEMKENQDKQL